MTQEYKKISCSEFETLLNKNLPIENIDLTDLTTFGNDSIKNVFSNKTFKNVKFPKLINRGRWHFEKCNLTNVIFTDIECDFYIMDSIVNDVKFPNFKSAACVLQNNTFNNVSFIGVNFNKSYFICNKLNNILVNSETIPNDYFLKNVGEQESFEKERILRKLIKLKKISNEELDKLIKIHSDAVYNKNISNFLHLENIDLSENNLSKYFLDDLRFTNVKFPKYIDRYFRRSTFNNVDFIDTDLQFSDFRGANLNNVLFENSNLEKSRFTDAIFNKVTYKNSLTSESFRRALQKQDENNQQIDKNNEQQLEQQLEQKLEQTINSINTPNNQLKVYSNIEFDELIKLHYVFLNGGLNGKQLILENADLRNVELFVLEKVKLKNVLLPKLPNIDSRYPIRYSELTDINFEGYDLNKSYFKDCKLININFNGVDLSLVTFYDNNLYNNIQFDQNTKFPPTSQVPPNDQLKEIFEKSRQRKKLTREEFRRLYEKNKEFTKELQRVSNLQLSDFGAQNRLKEIESLRLSLLNIDLSDIDLSEFPELFYAKLINVKFGKINNNNFYKADLSNSDFSESRSLSGSLILNICNFNGANLTNVNFGDLDVKTCYFIDSNVTNIKINRDKINNRYICFNVEFLRQDKIELEKQQLEKQQQELELIKKLDSRNYQEVEIKQNNIKEMSEMNDKPKLTQSELDKLCDDHAEWMNYQGSKGKQLDLSGLDIEHLDIKNVWIGNSVCINTKFGKIHNVSFKGSNLTGSSFSSFDIYANFIDTNLTNVIFNGSNLRRAVFNNITGKFYYTNDTKFAEKHLELGNIVSVHGMLKTENVGAEQSEQSMSTAAQTTTEAPKNPQEITNKVIEVEVVEIPETEIVKPSGLFPNILKTLKNNTIIATELSIGQKTAEIIYYHVNKGLLKFKVPKYVLENYLVKNFIMIVSPQLFATFVPFIPLNIPDRVKKNLEMACSASISLATEDTMNKIFDFAMPVFGKVLKVLGEGIEKKGLKSKKNESLTKIDLDSLLE